VTKIPDINNLSEEFILLMISERSIHHDEEVVVEQSRAAHIMADRKYKRQETGELV
jgi:hypothetical protein